jgi:hypothetical protein
MIAKANAARAKAAKTKQRAGFLRESDRLAAAEHRRIQREEHLAAREAGKIAAAALVNAALATFDDESFDDSVNASASDRLLALLREYHGAGGTHAV